MSEDKNIEYIGYEGDFLTFLKILSNKLKKEKRAVKIWCDLDFLPKFNNIDRITPIYYKRYPKPSISVKDAVKDGKLFTAFFEIIRRLKCKNEIKYRNYKKYLENKMNNIVSCCLNNSNGNLEVMEGFSEDKFKGSNNTVVLRRYSDESGMFSHLLVLMPYLRWAKDNNLNVYFDMSRGDSIYREKDYENAWDYFYEQPGSKPGDNNGSVISALFKISDNYKIPFRINCLGEVIGMHSVYETYVKLNDRMCSLVDVNWDRIQGGKAGKILGVKFRGTDYAPSKILKEHHFQGSCDEMIDRTRLFLEKYNYEYIYLCVEEKKNLDKFKEVFGGKVLYYDCPLIETYQSGTAAFNHISLVGKRRAGEDYIGSVMCLAKCDAILCSPNSGVYMTFIINGGKYEYAEIIDKGIC